MSNIILKAIGGAVVMALLAGCQTTGSSVKSTPSSAELPPLETRRAVLGDTYVWINKNGEERTGMITAVDAQYSSGESSNGCKWRSKRNAFAPGAEWTNCSGSTGTQTSQRLGGSIFPMTVGSTESWDYSGTNNKGDSWESTRNCEVVGIAEVTVPAGTFDTYHVRCADKWWVREWFVRSDGISVQGSNTRKVGSADRNTSWQLVSYTPAS